MTDEPAEVLQEEEPLTKEEWDRYNKEFLEPGRKWLREHRFIEDDCCGARDFERGDITISDWYDYDPELIEPCFIRISLLVGKPLYNHWLCVIPYDSEINDCHSMSYGFTPQQAIKNAIEDFDEEMRRRKEKILNGFDLNECLDGKEVSDDKKGAD